MQFNSRSTITKLMAFMFFLCFFHSNSNGQLVTLKEKNISIAKIFNEISNQTKYDFIYSDKIIKNAKPVTVDIKNKNLEEALKIILKDQPLAYELKNKTIIIKNKNNAQNRENDNKLVKDYNLKTINGNVQIRNNNGLKAAPNVNVLEKGMHNIVTTDNEGRFIIKVHPNPTLVFSSVGYKTVEVLVSDLKNIDVVLQEDIGSLNEVVVTGYGIQQKREITGAISQIKSSDIEAAPILTLDQALQGRMSGVNVTSGSGVPGGAIKVEIRGQGSISAETQPLYIIDGVPVNTEDVGIVASSNPLSFLDPKEIQSIEVLKDAAASSIYGAEAANGVVLITTKRGVSGPTVIDFSYMRGLVSPVPLIKVMNTQQYIDARIRAKQNYYPDYTFEQIRTEVLSELQLPITLTDQEILALPSYDWQKAAFRNGHSDKYSLAASGGSAKTQFRIASSYERNSGAVVGLDFKRATAAIRLNHEYNEKLSFRMDVNLATLKQKGAIGALGSYTYLSSPIYSAPLILPFNAIYKEDGSLNILDQGFPGSFTYNSVAAAELNDRWSNTNSILSKFEVNYKFNKDFTMRSYVGLDYRNILNNQYQDPRTNEALSKKGILRITQSYPISFSTTHNFNYNKTFNKKHKISALGGFEYRSYSRNYYNTQGEGFPSYQFRTLASAATITTSTSTWTGFKTVGLFFKTDYNYDNKYMVSAIIRRDGSSKFGVNNQFGWFPALSIGWDIARESFTKKYNWLDQFKFRVGYGETGNDQIGNFSARSLYVGTSYDGNAAIAPSILGNSDLRWERNSTINLGLDYSFLNHRISGTIEVYKRTSKDLILEQPIPSTTGYDNYLKNVGEVVNKGIELEINLVPVRNSVFSWTSGFNISFLKNRVTKLYDNLQSLPGDASVRVGYSLQTNFVTQYAGVNSATGKPFFYDADGNISYYPTAQGSSSYTLFGRGNRLSDFWGGWNNNITYKNLQLSFLIQYDYGREMLNTMALIMSRTGDLLENGATSYYYNQWTTPGQITSVPRAIQGGVESGALGADVISSRFLEDASYIRLKSINISYSFPARWRSFLKLNQLSVNFQAMNIFTLTKWSGYDPEFYIDDSNFTSNAGTIPQTRSYNIGINLKF